MAVTVTTTFVDTTSVVVTAARAYLKGVSVYNSARTATAGWLSLYNEAATPGTTEPTMVLYCPFATSNTSVFRFTFPRILFGTTIEVFFSDTSPVDASAWNAGTGARVEVYWERA